MKKWLKLFYKEYIKDNLFGEASFYVIIAVGIAFFVVMSVL